MDNSLPILIRPSVETDSNYVLANWVKHYYDLGLRNDIGRPGPMVWMPKKLYTPRQRQLIVDLLSSGARILVACSPGDPDQIFGFICYQQLDTNDPDSDMVVHWIHVKDVFRKKGIAKALIQKAGIRLDQEPRTLLISHPALICHTVYPRYRFIWLPPDLLIKEQQEQPSNEAVYVR